MTAVVHRVGQAKVIISQQVVAEIKTGLLILLGIRQGDNEEKAAALARRCAQLRIFEDEKGKFNLSLEEIKGEAMVVSQFTLLADTRRGRRPSFSSAEAPARAQELYLHFIEQLRTMNITTRHGVFGSRMTVQLENQGPVTIIMEE